MQEKKLLIVDDSADTLRVLQEICEISLENLQVIARQSAQDALELLEHEKVDLILTDIEMPEMSGVELIKHVQEKYATLPIIVITAYQEYDNVLEEVDVDAVFYKPIIDFDLVSNTIEKLLTQ